jgi:hypothetical protein
VYQICYRHGIVVSTQESETRPGVADLIRPDRSSGVADATPAAWAGIAGHPGLLWEQRTM